MVTLELSRVDARRLLVILNADRKEYADGIEYLKKMDPNSVVGDRDQTPEEAIQNTELAIKTIDRVMDQLRETKKD